MTANEFIKKWQGVQLKEKSSYQEHFLDLCKLVEHPSPVETDKDGSTFCFEKGAIKTGGGNGWADVWKRGHFAMEYKGPGGDLKGALQQVQRYALALENPPLLVVSDVVTIIVTTNFTNTVSETHTIALEDIGTPDNLQKLRWLFFDPAQFRPGITTAAITEKAATLFASLAQTFRERGHDPHHVAHFLNRLLFCFFAEDAELLPSRLVTRVLENGAKDPERATRQLKQLFAAMAKGGDFGADVIQWFNGGLFDDDGVLPLTADDLAALVTVAGLDWSNIEPSIFGTLFERGLDPSKRSQLGAHYTDPGSIMRIVRPVVIEPLEREWETAKAVIQVGLDAWHKGGKGSKKGQEEALTAFQGFMQRLADYRVLDPACGSGNFLYLALQSLKDLEHKTMLDAEVLGMNMGFAGFHTGPHNVLGIELNSYAAEMARVTVWIGEIQWMLKHGMPYARNPVLKPLNTISCRDAVLDAHYEGVVIEDFQKERDSMLVAAFESEWPEADAIVGNPPFLGGSKKRGELGSEYFKALNRVYKDRIPGSADLVTYWFEKARAQLEAGKTQSVGLVATNSIRGGSNRKVLERILETAPIFEAWSDEPWINNGAAVRVSLVCFGDGNRVLLDGQPVAEIHADLTAGNENSGALDLTLAKPLDENAGSWAYGSQEKGDFSLTPSEARKMLTLPNPNGRPNSDVIKRSINARQMVQRREDSWVVDFGLDMSLKNASLFEIPFATVQTQVAPKRLAGNDKSQAKRWWLHARPSPKYRAMLGAMPQVIATPCVSKHRLFIFLDRNELADHAAVVIARSDDTTFGILHSRFHELWSLGLCTWLGKGNDPRYTPTTTFETFPFPPGLTPNLKPESYDNPHAAAIADAAHTLNTLRERWLNPPEWAERIPEVIPGYPDRIFPKLGHEQELKKRTLTNLYNEPPHWLRNVHWELDKAVAHAYGWTDYTPEMSDDEILRRLLALNLDRS
jgi:type II restriction/modification system DNA methylase subunit YeeA